MVVKTSTFVGMSAKWDLTANWALLKSVAGQRLYTIQRRRPFSATRKTVKPFSFIIAQLI